MFLFFEVDSIINSLGATCDLRCTLELNLFSGNHFTIVYIFDKICFRWGFRDTNYRTWHFASVQLCTEEKCVKCLNEFLRKKTDPKIIHLVSHLSCRYAPKLLIFVYFLVLLVFCSETFVVYKCWCRSMKLKSSAWMKNVWKKTHSHSEKPKDKTQNKATEIHSKAQKDRKNRF